MGRRDVMRAVGMAGTAISAGTGALFAGEAAVVRQELRQELIEIYKGIYGREPSNEELARFVQEVRNQEYVGQIDSYEREDGTLETYERDDFEVPTELFNKLDANELGVVVATVAALIFAAGTALTFLGGRRS